jgi:O-antigen/teichoic acid export membrane protein
MAEAAQPTLGAGVETPRATGGPADPADKSRREFRSFLRSVGLLAGGRQFAALAFVGVVLVLPNVGLPRVVEQFLWAYYGSLIMTSVGGLGFERAAALAVARNGGDARLALVPLTVLRIATVPFEVAGLWLVMKFVGVTLPIPTFIATVVWIVGIQIQLPAFSALRTVDRRAVEPTIWVGMRLLEAPLLLGLAARGASSAVLVGMVAIVELAGGVVAMCELPGRWSLRSWRPSELDLRWRTMSAFALIELVGIAYLRADLLLVGRILGPTVGAAYGLLSRLLDGILGIQNSISLWLFADSTQRSAAGDDLSASPIRERSLVLFPRAAAAFALGAIVCAPVLGSLVTAIAPTIDTLRILLVALPFFVVSAIETFTRSAGGKNRGVLVVVGLGLAVNIGLNVFLLSTIGLVGAGWALLGSECVQVLLLYGTASVGERRLLRRTVRDVFACGVLLLTVALAANLAAPFVAGVAAMVMLGFLGAGLRSKVPAPRIV